MYLAEEGRGMVLRERIELSTSPLPMECSTTELPQHSVTGTVTPPDRLVQHAFKPSITRQNRESPPSSRERSITELRQLDSRPGALGVRVGPDAGGCVPQGGGQCKAEGRNAPAPGLNARRWPSRSAAA